METKQVIVIRNDLNMRKGKMCAQSSHASMSFLTKNLVYSGKMGNISQVMVLSLEHEYEVIHWLDNSFRKICLYVNSEQELIDLHDKAIEAGLVSHLVEDNGATEFNGVKTKTCIAIGPHEDSRFIGLTDHLPLL